MIQTIDSPNGGLTIVLSPCNEWKDHVTLGKVGDVCAYIPPEAHEDIRVAKELIALLRTRLCSRPFCLGRLDVEDD